MINHARTLLLNRSASYTAGLDNDVYIPLEFSPVPLTPFLTSVRNAIIPPTGSKQQELDVTAIIMHVLHSPDLLPYVLGLDGRITYDDQVAAPSALMSKHVTLNMIKSAACDVVPKYEFIQPSSLVPLAGKYTWSVSSVDARRVSVVNTKGMTDVVVLNSNSSSLYSSSLDIIPGFLSIYFELPSLVFTGTFKVNYELTVRASYDVVAGFDALKQVFSVNTTVFENSKFPTVVPVLRDIWLHNPALVTQFGAGVLMYIYTLEGLRI